MKTQLLSKYPWKSSHEPLGVRKPLVKNPWTRSRKHATTFSTYALLTECDLTLFCLQQWTSKISVMELSQSYWQHYHV